MPSVAPSPDTGVLYEIAENCGLLIMGFPAIPRHSGTQYGSFAALTNVSVRAARAELLITRRFVHE
jgi:hypothetical protein